MWRAYARAASTERRADAETAAASEGWVGLDDDAGRGGTSERLRAVTVRPAPGESDSEASYESATSDGGEGGDGSEGGESERSALSDELGDDETSDQRRDAAWEGSFERGWSAITAARADDVRRMSESSDDGALDSSGLVDMYHRLGEHTKSGKERRDAVQQAREWSAGESDTEGARKDVFSAEDESESSASTKSLRYVEKTFGIFSQNNPVRKFCIDIVEMREFDWFIMLVIAANTIVMCLAEPERMHGRGCAPHTEGPYNKASDVTEYVFTSIFSLEAVLKIMAYGFYGRFGKYDSGAYLRSSWNIADFTIVIISIVALLPGDGGGNISTLRLIRILRPLRAIGIFPSLRLLIETMLKALAPLGNVVVLFLLFFAIFGIIGVQFFAGKLQNRCYDVLPASVPCANYTAQVVERCITRAEGDAVLLASNMNQPCTVGTHGLWKCSETQLCLVYQNPNYGFTSFDDIGWAALVLFQTVTLEYWTPVLEGLMDALSPVALVWFVPVIFIGSFVILNLALAIITMVYDDNLVSELHKAARESYKQRKLAIVDRLVRTNSASSAEFAFPSDKRLSMREWIQGRFNRVLRWYTDSWQPLASRFVESKLFFTLINGIILLNTVTLAMEYDGMPDSYSRTLERTNLAFTVVFMVEMIAKLLAFGLPLYVKDRMNWLDAGIVIISAVELVLNKGDGKSRFTVLRALRVFRILKLVRSWESLQKTLKTIGATLLDLRSFVVVLALFVLIFALIGMQLFGGKYCRIDPKPRSNFDTFNNAVMTVVQVITHEDWPLVMFDTMRTSSRYSIVYFVIVLILGDFIILNSLIVILLSNFDNRKADLQKELEEAKRAKENRSKGVFNVFTGLLKSESRESRDSDKQGSVALEKFAQMASELLKREKRRSAKRSEDLRLERAKKMIEEQSAQEDIITEVLKDPKKIISRTRQPGAMSFVPLENFSNRSFFGLFAPSNPVRKLCFAIADDKRFDWCIIVLICVSSLTMVWETPDNMDNDSFARRADIIDYCFTSLFVTEMVIKWIALGMYNSDKCSYAKNPWNVLDGTIVTVGLIGMALGSSAKLTWIRSLRTLRVLRPLRLLGKVQGLKVVINALLASLPSLANVALVSLIVWIIFAISGMSLFMGKFKECSDPSILTDDLCVDGWNNSTSARVWDVITSTCSDVSVTTEAACTGSYTRTEYITRRWASTGSTFDSFPEAMLTLFETTSGEGWTVTMWHSIDAVSEHHSPVRDKTPIAGWYFIVFIILSNFFLLNMCIGTVIDTFLKISTSSMTRTIMSESQSKWVAQQRAKTFAQSKSFFQKPPDEKLRQKVLKLVQNKLFEVFIMGTIILNTIVLMMETSHDGDAKRLALRILNYIFTGIFACEAALKLFALHPKQYFSSGWNTFDFTIVVTSIAGAVFSSGTGSSAFRALRIGRVFRMVRQWKAINTLFQTLIMTIPALANISLLLALLFFIYAILGMQIFGRVALGTALSRHYNFRDFGNSLLTLMRMMTGEGWQEIMYDCMNKVDCDASAECTIGTCCGTTAAPLYFVSFVALTTFAILNLLIAVVLDNFAVSRKQAENQDVTEKDVKAFRKVWKKFDPDLTGFIATVDVQSLIRATPHPLGFKGRRVSDLSMISFISALNIQAGLTFIHYTEFLQAVTAKVMGVDLQYLPLEIRKELEADRLAAKRSSLAKLRARVKRRATIVARFESTKESTGGARFDHQSASMMASQREREIAEHEHEQDVIRTLDGQPVSLGVMLVVLRLQRNFRARKSPSAGA